MVQWYKQIAQGSVTLVQAKITEELLYGIMVQANFTRSVTWYNPAGR